MKRDTTLQTMLSKKKRIKKDGIRFIGNHLFYSRYYLYQS